MQKTKFKHLLLPRVELTDTTVEGVGRIYHTPDGDFESVTTLIGKASDNSWLAEWRVRVGDEEANGISQQARVRGSALHNLAEKYVMNDPDWKKGAMPANLFTFSKIKKVLDERVDVVYGIEYPLWSTMLRTAGRSDLPAMFDGVDSIVDYKTSRKIKSREDITGYFIQSATYALMLEERTGLKIPQIVVLLAVDDGDAQVFVEKARTWYDAVADVFIRKQDRVC